MFSWLQIGIVAAVLAAVVGGFAWVEHLVTKVGEQKTVIAQREQTIKDCGADKAKLRSGLDDANASIDAFKKAGQARAAAAEKRQADAEKESAFQRGRAEALLTSMPKPGESVCDAATRELRTYATERQAVKP